MNIPIPIRKSKPLLYPFDKVNLSEPYFIQLKENKIVSASNSARQYAKRKGKTFVIRTGKKGITIYRTK